MRVLLVHTRYQTRGGEDGCFDAEHWLLRDAGVEVETYEDDNRRLDDLQSLAAARETVWSRTTYDALRARVRRGGFDLVHVHNFFPLLSPAVYHAAKAEGAAVVQTLHNYRLMCPSAIFYRNQRVCEDCLGRFFAWPGVLHACYRGSRMASAAVATMLAGHRLAGTWRHKVDVYITLNDFGRRKFVEGGLPADKVVVKPNFIAPDPGPGEGRGDFALFAGRLTAEKGIEVMLEAWRELGARIPLLIMGDGPAAPEVEAAAREIDGVTYLARRPFAEVLEHMGRARFFVFPSVWYEGFPRTIIECYARSLPILASAIGPVADVVVDGRTGLHCRPGDPQDLVAKAQRLLDNPAELGAMRAHARAEFESRYTASANLEQLLGIYERAMAGRRVRKVITQPA